MPKTKFEELCDAYKTTRQNFFRYRDECVEFFVEVVSSLEKEWGIPNVRYIPLNEPAKPGMMYFPHGATHFDEEAGVFVVGVVFAVYSAPNAFPQDNIVLRLKVRKSGGRFLFGWADRDLSDVGDGNIDLLRPELDELFRVMVAEYPSDPTTIRADSAEPQQERRIRGFTHEKPGPETGR